MIDFEQDRLACVKTIQPPSQMANQCLDSLLQLWGACISHCDMLFIKGERASLMILTGSVSPDDNSSYAVRIAARKGNPNAVV